MRSYFDRIMDIGEQMLLCGAEVHRVEDSIERMGNAIGFIRTDVFIITTSMVVTVHTDSECFTQTRRIKAIGTNLEKLHRLNALSRSICSSSISLSEIETEIERIRRIKPHSPLIQCLSYMVIAGAFTVFFGGSVAEAAVSLIISLALFFISSFSDKMALNKIIGKFIGAFAVTLGAYLAMVAKIIPSMDMVIIGNIMLLIPGVGLTNGLRDLLAGDSIAGLLRLIEAVLFALAIAAGYFLFIFLLGGSTV